MSKLRRQRGGSSSNTSFDDKRSTVSRQNGASAIFDLFRLPPFRTIFSSRAYPVSLQVISGFVFATIILYGFLGPPHGEDNFAVVVTWMLWWLLLPFSFLFLARLWCGVCPLGGVSDVVQKIFTYKRKTPGLFLRKKGVWIAGLSFLALAWAGMVWHFDDIPWATAFLLLSILFGVIITSLIYERRSWCRYLCPLGIMTALYSMVSLVGLRSSRKICREECAAVKCYKVQGQKDDGCPMFEFPRVMESNRNCSLCGDCVKHCPQQSMRLLVRNPVAELWQQWKPFRGEAYVVMILLALVFVEVIRMTQLYPDYMKWAMEANVGLNYDLFFSLSLLAVVGIIIVSYALSSRLSALISGEAKGEAATRFAYAYIPIALAGHLGTAIQHLAQHGVRATKVAINQVAISVTPFDLPAVSRGASYEFEPSLKAIQLFLLVLGTFGALYACWKIAKLNNPARTLATGLPHLMLIGFLSASFLILFFLPMGLLH